MAYTYNPASTLLEPGVTTDWGTKNNQILDDIMTKALDKSNTGTESMSGSLSLSGGLTTGNDAGIGLTNPSDYWSQAHRLVVGGEANIGITIASSSTSGNSRLAFADTTTGNPGLDSGGLITYNHTNDEMQLRVNGADALVLDSSQNATLSGGLTADSVFIDSGTESPITFGSGGGFSLLNIDSNATTETTSVRVFRGTNTSGDTSWLLYKGDGTTSAAVDFRPKTGSYTFTGTSTSAFTVEDGSNADVFVVDTSNKRITNVGFTDLGNTGLRIKTKKITGTTASSQGSSVSVAHGLTLSKIISLDVLVDTGTTRVGAEYTRNAGFQFSTFAGSTNIDVANSVSNSSSILSKSFTALIIYEE